MFQLVIRVVSLSSQSTWPSPKAHTSRPPTGLGSFSVYRDRPPPSFHRQHRGSASLYLAIECRCMELLQMSLKCSMSVCNDRRCCTADVGCWFLFASWQSSAVMRARKVSLWLRSNTMRQRHLSHPRDAPYLCTTDSAARSLRLGVN